VIKKALIVSTMVSALLISPAHAIVGFHGETLSVSKTTGVKSGDTLVVTGQHFDETVGIYVALCVSVKPGTLPSPVVAALMKPGLPVLLSGFHQIRLHTASDWQSLFNQEDVLKSRSKFRQ
jgi:hypothetical protein